MHIRVSIDVSKPLMRRKNLNLGLPKPVWVIFPTNVSLTYAIAVGSQGIKIGIA